MELPWDSWQPLPPGPPNPRRPVRLSCSGPRTCSIPVSGKLVDHGVVVVSGTRIQAVGSNAKIPEGAKIIDLGDATLLPGLIDAHVHLSMESSPNWYHDWYDGIMRFPAEQALYGAHYAKATLEAGITTVRDVGSTDYISLGLRNAIKAGMIPGPAHAGLQLRDRIHRRTRRSGSGAGAADCRGGPAPGGLQWPGRVPRGRALPDQIRRRCHQVHAVRRRAVAV